MPNPTIEKLREGIQIARENNVDLLLAVGGGSVCDYAKAVSASVNCEEDPWEKYFERGEAIDCEIVPVGCVLTMVGTGSEMNGTSVITNYEKKQKVGCVFGTVAMPKFTVLNPMFTMSLPHYQMVAGIFDIFSHIGEQYFSGADDNTSDYLSEGLMRSVIHSSRIANRDPEDYEARSNIMWSATWALNTLLTQGKTTDWMTHMMGQAVAVYTDATHGMTLAAVVLPYFRYLVRTAGEACVAKYARFATEVWRIPSEGRSQTELALAGLDAMEEWMKELGLVMNLTELGVDESMIEGIADSTPILKGGYKVLTREEIVQILKESL